MKIKLKLVLGFLVVALLVGIVGYFSITQSQKALQKSIGEHSVLLAHETMDKIDRIIYYRSEEINIYSTDLILKEAVMKSNQEFQKLDNIQEFINEKDQEWVAVPKEKITLFMQELINNKLSEELRGKIEFYEEKYGYKVFGEIFVTNKHGANAAQTWKTTDYYQADEEWWQNAKEYGLFIADVEYDRSAEVYSTDIGIRIDDEDGNFLGVIKAVLNVEEIVNILKELKVHEMHEERATMEFKLLTKDGKIIYSTEKFEILEDISEKLFLRLEHTEVQHIEERLDYFIAEGDKPGEGEELFSHTHSKGYRDYKGLGWILIVEHETKEIFAPVAKLRNTLLIISFIIIILASLIGLFISKSITKPIEVLHHGTEKIERGNLNIKVGTNAKDEIGQLGRSFDKMLLVLKKAKAKLEGYSKNLEKDVKNRTKELQSKVYELEKFSKLTVGRELKMIELKKDINELCKRLGEKPKYDI